MKFVWKVNASACLCKQAANRADNVDKISLLKIRVLALATEGWQHYKHVLKYCILKTGFLFLINAFLDNIH